MSWLDEANAINAKNAAAAGTSWDKDLLLLDTLEQIEAFKREIREIHEHATEREMNQGIERGKEHFDKPYSRKDFLLYIKQYVENWV